MNERRFDIRKLVNTPVRLYHPEHGRLDGVTRDISYGGVAITLDTETAFDMESTECPILLRPMNSDVLFPVVYLRQMDSNLVVKFLE